MIWSIDGVEWDFPCDITRIAQMNASEISGFLLDKSYYNDVMGTYLSYDVKIACPIGREDEYSTLYEILTKPVDGHTFVLPYNQGTVTIAGRIENLRDEYRRPRNGEPVHWRLESFTIVANHPTKTMSLNQVLARGRTPLPELASASEGDTYTYIDGVWVEAPEYEDLDDEYF